MSTKHENPYREGCAYNKVFDKIQKDQIVTRRGLIEAGFSPHDVTVVLSPRGVGTCRGDCRGNMSAKGHIYYMEKLNKVEGEDRRFRLRWRKGEGEETKPHNREVKKVAKVEQKKVKKATKKVKTTNKTITVTVAEVVE